METSNIINACGCDKTVDNEIFLTRQQKQCVPGDVRQNEAVLTNEPPALQIS